MNNSREKFELKISMEYEQPPCLDRDGDGYDDSYVDNAWWGWQAATEQCKKEIAEKDAMIAEYDRLMSIDDTRIVLLQHNIVELQAPDNDVIKAREQLRTTDTNVNYLEQQITSLRAELEKAKKDGERYQWLRKRAFLNRFGWVFENIKYYKEPTTIDEDIDNAMKGKG